MWEPGVSRHPKSVLRDPGRVGEPRELAARARQANRWDREFCVRWASPASPRQRANSVARRASGIWDPAAGCIGARDLAWSETGACVSAARHADAGRCECSAPRDERMRVARAALTAVGDRRRRGATSASFDEGVRLAEHSCAATINRPGRASLGRRGALSRAFSKLSFFSFPEFCRVDVLAMLVVCRCRKPLSDRLQRSLRLFYKRAARLEV